MSISSLNQDKELCKMKLNLFSGVMIAVVCCACSEVSVNSDSSSSSVIERLNSTSVVKDSSTVKSEDRELVAFSKLNSYIPCKLDVTIGSPQSVKVTCNQESLGKITTEVEGDTLNINSDNLNVECIEVSVVVDKLESVEVSGAGTGAFKNLAKSGLTKVSINGASNVDLDSVKANDFDVTVSGASKLKAGGNCDNLSLVVSGASGVLLSDLKAENGTVNISGASRCNSRVTGKVSGTISGASSLVLSGNPEVNEVEASGASQITVQ